MGAIGGMLGIGGGAGGSGFSGPDSAQIDKPATIAQANEQYKNSQDALEQQKSFLQAVQAQHGLVNQSNVFNQMQGVANGTGPNPAQTQLAQATGANVANQAALMAGQRGSSANVGLIARQAAQQGANTQQQAAGQGATLQAQQSLNALQQMGQMATTQAAQQQAATSGYTQAAQGEQSNVLNAITGQNQAATGMQGNINNANAGLAGSRMGQQGNLLGGITGGIGSVFGLAEGGMVPKYADGGQIISGSGQYAPIDPNAPDVFDPNALTAPSEGGAQPQPMISPSTQQATNAVTSVPTNTPKPPGAAIKGPQSGVGKFLHSFTQGSDSSMPKLTGTSQVGSMAGKAIGAGLKSLFGGPSGGSEQEYADANVSLSDAARNAGQDVTNLRTEQDAPEANNDMAAFVAAHGGQVPALVSPGEHYLPPKAVKKVAKEGKNPLKVGERIPGKPKVKGDSYKNDTVKKTLQSGGIVIPNHIMQSQDPAHEAYKFVAATIAKNGKSLPSKKKSK